MKKFFVMILIMIVMLMKQSAYAEENIKVIIDNETVEFDVQPQIINDRTMVPMRAVFEKLGALVDWNQDTQTATAIKDLTKISLIVGEAKIIINDEEKVIDVSPCVIDGRTLVPIRVISEALDMLVEWDGATKTIKISSAPNDETSIAYDKLKNAVIKYGIYNAEKDYTIRYAPDGTDYGCLITYDPQYELSILYVSENENIETGILINFFKEKLPELTMKVTLPEECEYTIYGEYGQNKEFIKKKENVHTEVRQANDELMKSILELIDLLLQKNAGGLTLYELGISY